MSAANILVVDDDDRLRETLGILLRSLGHRVELAASVKEGKAALERNELDLVISDLRLDDGSGLDLLEAARGAGDDVPFIVVTAYATVDSAVEAMKKGAFDYLQKPLDAAEVEIRTARALDQRRYKAEHDYLREAAESGAEEMHLIGVSAALRSVMEMVRRVAPSDASVLITGETGTGKELIARAIHALSPRADRLLVPLNLTAIPEELLESELFGHVRGAFTGAGANREGKFELANGGSLFLDEVGDLAPRVQPKLLRALQDQVIERVGSNQARSVNVRVISATNRDLDAAVAAGEFRADLYYRLRVVEIRVPALRERREDIRYLAGHFLRKFGRKRKIGVPAITAAALELLEQHDWPGNVRQLENAIERAVVLCPGDTIAASLLDIGKHISGGGAGSAGTAASGAGAADAPAPLRLDIAVDRIEKDTIERALEETGGVKSRAARVLGVSERTLWYKLRKHGLS